MTDEEVLAIGKTVPNDLEWTVHPTHVGTHLIETGISDYSGVRVRGLRMLLYVLCLPSHKRTGESWKFRIERAAPGRQPAWIDDLYRLEVKLRPGIPPGHHDAPHAHRLGARVDLPEALRWTWKEALEYFCREANISPVPDIDHPIHHFKLRP